MEKERKYWDSLPRVIAPSTIVNKPHYVEINRDLLARCLILGIPPTSDIGGYPTDLNQRLLDELLSISITNVKLSISFAVMPIPTHKSMKMLDEALFKNRVSQETSKKKDDRTTQPEFKKVLEEGEFKENYTALFKNKQKMYSTAHIITIYGRTEEEIRKAESMCIDVLESNRVYYEIPDYRQMETFLAALPIPVYQEYTFCELFSYHTAALMALRNPNSRTDDKGLLIGNDLKTGRSIMIDIDQMAANHAIITGATRSGKTFSVLLLLMRAMTMLRRRIIYITPKADAMTDYRNVATTFKSKASIIDIGHGRYSINPLEITQDSTASKDSLRSFDDHCLLVDQFFTVLFEGTKTVNMSMYLNETLIECYRQKGIIRENPDSWQNCKEWPTLLDLRKIWLRDAENKNVTAQALCDKSFMFETAWDFLNKKTDIDLGADFIVIDLSNVPDSLQDALNVFFTGMISQRFKTNSKKKTIIACDEARVFLTQEKLSKFLLRILTQGGSYGLALWLITQQPSDLAKVNLSEEFRTNTQLAMIMGNLKKEAADIVKDFFKLDESTINDLLTCGTGEGLFKCGESLIPVEFKPTQWEMNVISGRKLSKTDAAIMTADTEKTFFKNEVYSKIAAAHGFVLLDWLKDSENQERLSLFSRQKVPAALRAGLTYAFIRKDMIENGYVHNQSIDHFSTVMQIAGYLMANGFDVTINHNEGADIVFETAEGKIGLEYERPGSHNIAELQEKKQQLDSIYFIGTSENLKFLSDAVGEDFVIKRGQQLSDFLEGILLKQQIKK